MKITLDIPEFNTESGIELKWESGFVIETKIEHSAITIVANREGLISLANHLLNLSRKEIPPGYHLHLDEYNALEEGSIELILEKK